MGAYAEDKSGRGSGVMETINEKIRGQVLSRDLQLNGMSEGSIGVPSGVVLQLNGTIVGDLTVESGGTADVNGTVSGSVYNKGGTVTIHGVIAGSVIDTGEIPTRIVSGAVVMNNSL